jgi:hypothetical protein
LLQAIIASRVSRTMWFVVRAISNPDAVITFARR